METLLNLAAGAISGVVADVVTHPLSTVKTRLQVEGAQASFSAAASSSSSSAATAAAAAARPNPIMMLHRIWATEGMAALFRGVGVVVAAAAPGQAMYFSGYELAKKSMGDSPYSGFASGVSAQLCGSLLWVPMDVIKERLQIEGQLQTVKNYGSSWAATRGIVATEGVLGLYRAYWIHQMTWAPFNGIYFATYEASKKYLNQSKDVESQSVVVNLTSSLIGASVASVATSPLDLVKTRLQVQGSNPALFDYDGPLDALRKILRREGPRALFDGVLARVIWLTPRLSIAVPTYEFLKLKFSQL